MKTLVAIAILTSSLMAHTPKTDYEGFSTVKEFKQAFMKSHNEWFNAVKICSTDKKITTREGSGICLQTFMETRDIKESVKYGSYMVKGTTLSKEDSNAIIGAAKLDIFITKECVDMNETKSVKDIIDCRNIIVGELK